MDVSLAYPLYFASRGVGVLRDEGRCEAYTARAKVFLSGLGADE
jgi:asparagine synthetase B (glutamine-hydrolysing)